MSRAWVWEREIALLSTGTRGFRVWEKKGRRSYGQWNFGSRTRASSRTSQGGPPALTFRGSCHTAHSLHDSTKSPPPTPDLIEFAFCCMHMLYLLVVKEREKANCAASRLSAYYKYYVALCRRQGTGGAQPWEQAVTDWQEASPVSVNRSPVYSILLCHHPSSSPAHQHTTPLRMEAACTA